MIVERLLRVGRNVAALEKAQAFYGEVLGFAAVGPAVEDPALARLLGVERLNILRMRLAAQEIELSECFPAGAAYPAGANANDLWFQHLALVTRDIAASHAKLQLHGVAAISQGGPVQLPAGAGGVIAYKFRDPEGHPLEFLQFPKSAGKPDGYDHSAISVSDVGASRAFYGALGLRLDARQINQGAEQDALDGLGNVAVDVLALAPPVASPHVELLCYRRPLGARLDYQPADLCADRLVFKTGEGGLSLRRDPDGHIVLLDGR